MFKYINHQTNNISGQGLFDIKNLSDFSIFIDQNKHLFKTTAPLTFSIIEKFKSIMIETIWNFQYGHRYAFSIQHQNRSLSGHYCCGRVRICHPVDNHWLSSDRCQSEAKFDVNCQLITTTQYVLKLPRF